MTDLTRRVTALEETIARMEPLLIRIDERLNHTATKAEMEALRGDLGQQMEALRGDLGQQMEALRFETTQKIEALRSDTTRQIESLRSDTTRQIESLRSDTTRQIESLRLDTTTQIETLRAELRAGLAEKPGRLFLVTTVITIFGLCAAIVAATVAGLQYIQPVP